MVYVTRREVFSAAHRLHNDKFSEEENRKIFGKCNNANWHGHNYTLEVMVAGEPGEDTGYVIDLKVLKKIIKDNIIKKVDHKNLNMEVDFMAGIIPTTENIAIQIWKELEDKIPTGKLYSVKIYETENNYAEYRGE